MTSIVNNTFTIPDSNEALEAALTRLAGHINAAQYRFLKLLAALIEREAWHGDAGLKSPAHWLNYYCGIDLGAAREKVRVAKCLATLPEIDAAFSKGIISYSKVRAMTRSATPENEAFLLHIATHGTAQHVEKLIRKLTRATRLAAPRQDQCQYEAREFTWHYDDDGMLAFRGRLPAAEGAAFLRTMERLVQGSPKQKANPAPTFPQKRADALIAMADLALAKLADDGKSASSADKYQVVVHIHAHATKSVSAETSPPGLVTATPPTPCTLESGDIELPLAASAAKRLACDASLVTVLEDDSGKVLNVGRKTRTIPPAIRRALNLRDGGCRFPGCCESRFVDAHHIHHWCDGGETRLDNLVLLCRRHHTLMHQEGFRIEHGNEGLEFVRADGRALPPALRIQFADYAESGAYAAEVEELAIEDEHDRMGMDIDAHTAVTRWLGETMDYSLAVGSLMSIGEKASVRDFHQSGNERPS